MSAKPFFVCSQVRLLFEYLHISHYHILISDAIVWLYGCPIPTNMSWNTKTSGWFICTFKHVSCSDKLQKEICTTNLNVIMFIARNCISRKLLNLKYMHIESLKCKMSNTQLYILYSIYLYILYTIKAQIKNCIIYLYNILYHYLFLFFYLDHSDNETLLLNC